MKRMKTRNTRMLTQALQVGGIDSIQMPKHSQVLGVHFDTAVWLTVAGYLESEDWETRRFATLRPTDRLPMEEGTLMHIGSVHFGGHLGSSNDVAHVFEIDSPEDGNIRYGAKRGSVSVAQNAPVHGTSMQIGVLSGGINGPGVMIQ